MKIQESETHYKRGYLELTYTTFVAIQRYLTTMISHGTNLEFYGSYPIKVIFTDQDRLVRPDGQKSPICLLKKYSN